MKSRRLTETDLVNMAFLPTSEKERRIANLLKPKRISGSYEPFRDHIGDAVNEQYPMFSELHAPTSLDKLEKVIEKVCAGNSDLLAMNLPVARATHAFSVEKILNAERLNVRPVVLPFGHKYEFGMPLLMRYDNIASVAFPDLRRTAPLTASGRVTTLSWMHQRFRANYPDHADLTLEIWRYENNADRTVKPIRVEDHLLVEFDRLWEDATETYQILHYMERGATEEKRKRAGGGFGPLFD